MLVEDTNGNEEEEVEMTKTKKMVMVVMIIEEATSRGFIFIVVDCFFVCQKKKQREKTTLDIFQHDRIHW